MRSKNKRELFDALAAEAGVRLGMLPGVILRGLDGREKLGSTALGHGVALPHAQIAGVPRPFIALVRLAQAIEFEANDEVPVDVVLVVLWPEGDSQGLLAAMSRLCKAMRAPELARRVRRAPDPATALSSLRDGLRQEPSP
jgi:PTS system nitrogen regulatory IIA component